MTKCRRREREMVVSVWCFSEPGLPGNVKNMFAFYQHSHNIEVCTILCINIAFCYFFICEN